MEQLTDSNEWAMISNNEHDMVHFFNEPERAGISAKTAAEMWMEKMVPLRSLKGKQLIGPGCASDPAGEEWLAEFMKIIQDQGEAPDFLGLHYYGPDATAAIHYFEKMYRASLHSQSQFYSTAHLLKPGLRYQRHPYPVVVSEIASVSRTKKDVFQFTAQVANWMDQCPWIFEYAFFGCMAKVADDFVSPEAQLMNSDGTLRLLMQKLMNEQPVTEL